jgi:ATP-dependent Clp protease adaptor protein ClpS
MDDDVNTFDWVIETLMEVCGHSEEQAEQCSIIIHYKGKCAVKNGDYDTLKPMCDAITERNIGATIEMMVKQLITIAFLIFPASSVFQISYF